MTELLALGLLGVGSVVLLAIALWDLGRDENRPLLDLFETFDFTAPVPPGMPAYIDPRTKDAA